MGGVVHFSSPVIPLSFRAQSHDFAASSNTLETEEFLESIYSIPFGSFFMLAGGWSLSL